MKTFLCAIFASLLLATTPGPVRAQTVAAPSCEDFRCEFQARLDQDCPCDAQSNHGQYVSCVAHIVNALVAEGLPTSCKGKLTKCAARSVCGKQAQDFSTCTTFVYGTCVLGDSATGTCDNDPAVACTVNTDCVVSSQCRITRHGDACVAAGGALNLSPTCCSTCAITPP